MARSTSRNFTRPPIITTTRDDNLIIQISNIQFKFKSPPNPLFGDVKLNTFCLINFLIIMNNFFDETTSNYSDAKEESLDRSVNKRESTTGKKNIKPSKNISNCTISERYLYHPDMELIDLSQFISQYV